MLDEAVLEGEIYDEDSPSIETVNRHALSKLDELINAFDAKTEPDMVRAAIESLSRLNASYRNNNIFTPPKSAEEELREQQAKVMKDMMK